MGFVTKNDYNGYNPLVYLTCYPIYYPHPNLPWVEKVDQIRKQTKILRIYFNNHYGGKAVVNAMQFKEMFGMSATEERRVLERAQTYVD